MKTIFEIYEHISGYYSIVLSSDKSAKFPLFGGDSAWEDCYDKELMEDILNSFNEFYEDMKNETLDVSDEIGRELESLLIECINLGFQLDFEKYVVTCDLCRLKKDLIEFYVKNN